MKVTNSIRKTVMKSMGCPKEIAEFYSVEVKDLKNQALRDELVLITDELISELLGQKWRKFPNCLVNFSMLFLEWYRTLIRHWEENTRNSEGYMIIGHWGWYKVSVPGTLPTNSGPRKDLHCIHRTLDRKAPTSHKKNAQVLKEGHMH